MWILKNKNKQANKTCISQIQELICCYQRGSDWESEMGEEDQEVQTSGYKINVMGMCNIENIINNIVLILYGHRYQTFYGDHFAMHTSVESVCCALETNIVLYVN